MEQAAYSDDEGEFFIDDSDIIEEITLGDEDLPDVDDDDEDDEDPVTRVPLCYDSVHTFTGHGNCVYAIACSPTDASLVASGGKDNNAFLWRIGQKDSAHKLEGHEETVSSLTFCHDGQLLASGGVDAAVKIWDMSTGKLRHTFTGAVDEIEWVKWHPRGHSVMAGAGSGDMNVWLWDLDANVAASPTILRGHSGAVTCGDFTPNGQTICTGSSDGMRIWNTGSGQGTRGSKVKGTHSNKSLSCLTITSDSNCSLAGTEDGFLSIVHIRTQQVVSSLQTHNGAVQCIGLSSGKPCVATGSSDNMLVTRDLQYPELTDNYQHKDWVTCLKWLGESCVATGCRDDGLISLWDTRAQKFARTFDGHSELIQSLSVSANGNFLVSASDDGTAQVFDLLK